MKNLMKTINIKKVIEYNTAKSSKKPLRSSEIKLFRMIVVVKQIIEIAFFNNLNIYIFF